MATTISAFATSHATALVAPDRWDGLRVQLREVYTNQVGSPPPDEPAEVALERDPAGLYKPVAELHAQVAAQLKELQPDVLIIIGNDQDENFGLEAAPQFAIFTGEQTVVTDRASGQTQVYRCNQDLSLEILESLTDQGFDVVQTRRFRDNTLVAHAFTQIAQRFAPDAGTAILPIFVNAVTPPYSPPRRCFEFGRALRGALASATAASRVVLCASGGLSHFTVAQFALAGYKGPYTLGSICADFDRNLVDAIRSGRSDVLLSLTSDELTEHGDGEFRQALALLGALPDGAVPRQLIYAPIYSAMLGTWVAYWDLDDEAARVA